MREAVIVVDMIYDFVYGALQTERGERIIPNVKELLENARKAEKPVIFSGDAHLPSDPEIEVWGEHAMRGSAGAAPLEELSPEPTDFVMEKRTYSAFHETGLDLLLRTLGIDTVVICGLHTDTCDRHTAADAFFRGYKVIVPEDCVQAFTDEAHSSGLEYLENVYGARIAKSGELSREWGVAAPVR